MLWTETPQGRASGLTVVPNPGEAEPQGIWSTWVSMAGLPWERAVGRTPFLSPRHRPRVLFPVAGWLLMEKLAALGLLW